MDPDGSSILTTGSLVGPIALLLVLILCNAFFVMAETAVIGLPDNKLKKQAGEGNSRAQRLLRLTANPSRFLAAMRTGVTLSGYFAAAVTAAFFSGRLMAALSHLPLSPRLLWAVSVIVVTAVLSYIVLVFGEIVPKRIAAQHPARIAFALSGPIAFACALARPFSALLSVTAGWVLRLVGLDPHQSVEEVTEEEIRMLIDVGGESGTIEQSEKDMLNNVFEFDERTAGEMMTHRTEITAVELGTPLEEIVGIALDSGYSRIPVYEDDLDSIAGILYVKDLLELVSGPAPGDFDLRRFMREPFYVPESMSCMSLLGQFQLKKIHMAVVVDEYGGTAGLVSMEDLLESIVGNIQDEYDDEEEEIAPCGDGTYLVDGLTALEDVCKFFGLEIEDEDEYDTIGGYVTSVLGYIPDEGDTPSIQVHGIRFTVREMDERRIASIHAAPLPAEEAHSPELKPREA